MGCVSFMKVSGGEEEVRLGEAEGGCKEPNGETVDAEWNVPVGEQEPEPAHSEQLEKIRPLLLML